MMKRLTISLIFCSLFILGCSGGVEEPPIIPIENFFKNPNKVHFKISPNGNHIAFVQSWKNTLNVFVKRLGEPEAQRVTSSENENIKKYFWANDERIIFIQDTQGDENYKLYGINLDGSDKKNLIPFEDVKVSLVNELSKIPNEILISLNKRDKKIFDVYRLNIQTGDLKLVAKNPGNITKWITDSNGKVKIAITTDGVNSDVLYRNIGTEKFQTIIKTDFKNEFIPVKFTSDNKYLYAYSNMNSDKMSLVKYDVDKRKEVETVFIHPEVDIESAIFSEKQNKLVGVNYIENKVTYEFFDENYNDLYQYLSGKFSDYNVHFISFSKDENKLIFLANNDKSQGTYYYFNRKKYELNKLADISPWLNENHMADVKPILYKTRDGLTIHGYLTLPKGVNPKDLPVVVMPHGGPWIRDHWKFSSSAQFLANRGYAVLQMNYRGSWGYGKDFWKKGFKQWGDGIQNDITDGVHWLIERDIADPEKIAIMGFSFGGYAALAGLTYTPELYVCGIDYAGISNIFTFLEKIPPYWESFREMLYEMVGDPSEDFERLRKFSPYFHTDKIQAPILIAQGGNDPRVSSDNALEIVEKLKQKNHPVTFIFKENEGHGFQNEENRLELYKVIEKFLKVHLGGRLNVSSVN